jgi:hypothetical protein
MRFLDIFICYSVYYKDAGMLTAYSTTKEHIETKTKQSKMIFHGQYIFNKIEQALANRSVSG